MPGRHFHKELTRLQELAAAFAEANPTLAPMLGGPSADPDAERHLEGVAFKTALLRQKLEDDFPEIVNDLLQQLFPHYPRPFPAATIIAFTPQPSFGRTLTIAAGTKLASVPVDGTACTFSTAWDVEVHPLRLNDVTLAKASARGTVIKLSLELEGMPLCQWHPSGINFLITGDYVSATDLTMLLHRHLNNIVITPEIGGEAAVLPPSCLKLVGFDPDHSLIPYPSQAFPGYRQLQEFFNFPEKHLFFKIDGLERWARRGAGNRFTISLELDGYASAPTRVRRENFVLHAVPALNIFAHEADPIRLDHRSHRHLLRPSGENPAHYQIFSVDKVTGFMRGSGRQRRYPPFGLFRPDNQDGPVFHASPRKSPVHAGLDVYLSVAHPPGSPLAGQETLSVELTCTNGTLPEGLRIGDISIPAAGFPEDVAVRNIMPVAPGVLPPLDPDLARRFSTHLSLNCLSLASAGNLRSLLELYVFYGNRSKAAVAANRKRIAGIGEVATLPCNRWVCGVLMNGREIRVKMRMDHFAGPGDMYLFGCLLDRFLGCCAGPNAFTVLTIEETLKGDRWQWTPRLGRLSLL